MGIFSYAPEPHIAFCPIVHPPHIQKWGHFCPSSPFHLPKCQTIMKVRVCVKASPAQGRRVLNTFRSESPTSPEKRSIWAPTPLSRGRSQLTFPNVKNDIGQKQKGSCFCEGVAGQKRATPSHKHGGDVWLEGRLKVQRWVFRCSGVCGFGGLWVWVVGVFTVLGSRFLGSRGVWWCLGEFRGLVAGFNFVFGRTKTTRNVIWGSMDGFRKMQHGVRAYN